MKRKVQIAWSCSNRVRHEHRTWVAAWICGLVQQIGWMATATLERVITKAVTVYCPDCGMIRQIRVHFWDWDPEFKPEAKPSFVCDHCARRLVARAVERSQELRVRPQDRQADPRLH